MNREDVTLTGELASSQGGASGVITEYATYLSGDVWDRDELRQTKVYSLSPTTEITARYRKWDYSVGHNRTKEYQTGSWLQTYANNNVDEITGITGTGGAPNASLGYDWAGNMTTLPDAGGSNWAVTYDAENRPVKMQKTDNTTRLELRYDYIGRRIEKAVFPNSTTGTPSSRTRFVYDGWNLIAELNAESSNAVLRTFTWGLDASHTIGGAGGVGGLVRMEEDGKEYYPIYDPSHNVTGLMRKNSNGTLDLVASYVLGPFGEVISTWTASGFTDTNPFRFSTKYTDLETGLVYFGYRYYSPKLGRFVCRDPKEESGGINLFAFVQNNAINRWDYLGLSWGSQEFWPGMGDDWGYLGQLHQANEDRAVQTAADEGWTYTSTHSSWAGTHDWSGMRESEKLLDDFIKEIDEGYRREAEAQNRRAQVEAGPIGQFLRQIGGPVLKADAWSIGTKSGLESLPSLNSVGFSLLPASEFAGRNPAPFRDPNPSFSADGLTFTTTLFSRSVHQDVPLPMAFSQSERSLLQRGTGGVAADGTFFSLGVSVSITKIARPTQYSVSFYVREVTVVYRTAVYYNASSPSGNSRATQFAEFQHARDLWAARDEVVIPMLQSRLSQRFDMSPAAAQRELQKMIVGALIDATRATHYRYVYEGGPHNGGENPIDPGFTGFP